VDLQLGAVRQAVVRRDAEGFGGETVVSASYALSNDFGTIASESDRRFKRLLMILALPALIFGIVIPFIEISGILKPDLVNPQRYAKLIKKVEEPKKEEEKKKPEVKKPELTKEQKIEKARARAEKRIAAVQDALADLRQSNLPQVNAPLASNVITSSSNTNTFASSAAQGSQGIGEIGVVNRGSTTGLGSRSGTSVKSNIGGGGEKPGFGGKAGRTLEEIQLVFDRNKGALYTMYVRETRTNPDMSGKLTVRMTIAPSGHVTACKVVGSELHNPDFEQKVVARILLMDFGAKDVGPFTLDYPINFFPTS
jgi:protein TonB